MSHKAILGVITLVLLCGLSYQDPAPQFRPVPFPRGHPHPQDSAYSGTQAWPQNLQNLSNTNPRFLDPLSSPAAEEILKNDIPRQLPPNNYGAPPTAFAGYPQGSPQGYPQGNPQGYPQGNSQGNPQGNPQGYPQGFPQAFPQAYPQIYKLDNLIIIANPPQAQPQPCIPRPPPDFPKPDGGSDDGLSNRFGEEPSKCTWAIVACCSPGNNNVRYNCFELLGCPGFFFDNSPCDSKTVMAAANAALEYYSNTGNSTSSGGTDTNRV